MELFQYMEVADEIESEEKAITLEQAKLVDPEAEIGDELGFQIFYLDADKDRAEEEDKKYGDILGIRQSRSTFGRIAAQTAKQVIIQRVREAERAKIFEEYKDRQVKSSPVSLVASSEGMSSWTSVGRGYFAEPGANASRELPGWRPRSGFCKNTNGRAALRSS